MQSMNVILYVYLSEFGGHGGLQPTVLATDAYAIWKAHAADAGPGAIISYNCQTTAVAWIIAKVSQSVRGTTETKDREFLKKYACQVIYHGVRSRTDGLGDEKAKMH